MFNIFTQKGPTIQKEVERLLTEMKQIPVDSDDYTNAVKNLSVLAEARAQKPPTSVNMDTVITVTATLFEILLVMNHERINVITTKAFSRITKPRI